jgi:hypothetical protein
MEINVLYLFLESVKEGDLSYILENKVSCGDT